MAKYEVIQPWHGVNQGQIVELDKVHPSLQPRVRKLAGQYEPVIEVTTAKAAAAKK